MTAAARTAVTPFAQTGTTSDATYPAITAPAELWWGRAFAATGAAASAAAAIMVTMYVVFFMATPFCFRLA